MLIETDPSPSARILCVDDEPAVLEGLQRILFDTFDVHTETRPARALERIAAEIPFDVIVSDMRMPEMDGAAFLGAARRVVPDTMRILLTGYADADAAAAAVNDGRIMRYLRKPCDPDELVRALHDAVRQRQLILAERELLEQTLSGAVRAMSEMLALLAPEIFRRSSALARAATHVATRLQLEPRWALEIAARLSMVGAVALPPDLLERERGGEKLSDVELAQIEAHPETGHKLLSNIPRLEGVAQMVRHQRHGNLLTLNLPRETTMGARVLRVLLALDAHARRGAPFAQARQTLRKSAIGDEAAILDALADYAPIDDGPTTRHLPAKQLVVGMVLAADVLGRSGAVVLCKGTEVTDVVRERLLNFARGVGLREPLTVLVPG
jgi:CheY-like chemotaxis protein